MNMQNILSRPLVCAAALAALSVSLTGCGGGSSNSGTPPPVTFTGTVLTSGGVPAVGDVVEYGSNRTLQATTDAQGHFVLSVPFADITSASTLIVLDSQGSVVGTQSVSPSGTAGISIALPTIPPPPVNLNPT